MSNKALLVDIKWCTGCHSCEVACQMLKGLPVDQFGIKTTQLGPWPMENNKWILLHVPAITQYCDMCADRVALGQEPSCVKHCQAQCMMYGTVEELAKELPSHPHAVLLTPAE